MRCPKCANIDDKVIDSRLSRDGSSIRRRRECLSCQMRFTSYEELERMVMHVIKRDGRREPFDRHKLIASLTKACEKRPVSIEAIERASDDIIAELEKRDEREISSRVVGRRTMESLRSLDEIAYIRYASVYRQFEEVGDFLQEIEKMEKHTPLSPNQRELF